jgi:hypothetical protein
MHEWMFNGRPDDNFVIVIYTCKVFAIPAKKYFELFRPNFASPFTKTLQKLRLNLQVVIASVKLYI